LTSISFSTTGVTYQWQSSAPGANVWSNVGSASSSYSLVISTQLSSLDYQCMVISSGPPLMTFPSTTVTVTNAYCAPSVLTYGCNYQDTINDFILVGEYSTQINDLATGCAANNYDNRTSESVTLFANTAYIAFISTQYTPGESIGIWIDFNNNDVFETTEEVTTGSFSSTADTQMTLTIPAIGSGATAGVHRMRASLAYSVTPTACGSPALYGEVQDYSVNIIAYACKYDHFSEKFSLIMNLGTRMSMRSILL
jgi:hypothetical protein